MRSYGWRRPTSPTRCCWWPAWRPRRGLLPPHHRRPFPPNLLSPQRDVAGGTGYCRRKVLLVKDKLEQLSALMKERQAALMQVTAVLEQRMQLEQAAGGGQQAPAAMQQKK